MTTSTLLSPVAQAVLDAFSNTSDGQYIEGVWVVNERTMLAAALRAAAYQVVPNDELTAPVWTEREEVRAALLVIADELEAYS